MRQKYKCLLRDFLADQIKHFRTERGLTQEKMSELLRISPRSYVDLEHKKYGCSALTFIFFISQLSGEERMRILNDFCALVEGADHHDAA